MSVSSQANKLRPDLAHSGLPYCHFGIHLSHLHPHRCLPYSKSSAQCPQGLLYSVGYVLLFSPTSRSGRPISLKERGRLPVHQKQHGDRIVKRHLAHRSLRGKNTSHPTNIFNFGRSNAGALTYRWHERSDLASSAHTLSLSWVRLVWRAVIIPSIAFALLDQVL
ncbi:hypothetical protein EDD22DRAFT_342856 [Suillus occidentalis]|nr:hypothetical protein EDD22DRAFT_342856 [Suillus occidentalis]